MNQVASQLFLDGIPKAAAAGVNSAARGPPLPLRSTTVAWRP